MKKPKIFIGSSTEGKKIANALQFNLQDDGDVYVWPQGVFKLGNSYLESLVEQLDKADFAILVLTSDDITISRNEETDSPRDNVLFELGLFIGRLGRNRSFFVYDKDANLKLPSDLSGISGAGFKLQQSGNLEASLGPACFQIRNAINESGIRPKINSKSIVAYNKRLEFCDKISGQWWETITPVSKSAISFVNIAYDNELLILNMNGSAYDKQGSIIAYWESQCEGLNFHEKKVVYKWKGWHTDSPSEPYEGVGEIAFTEASDLIAEGKGIFSDINIANIKSIEKKSFTLNRCSDAEVAIMLSKDKVNITKLIMDKLTQLI